MATYRLVLGGTVEVGVLVLRPDGTGVCTLRLPYRGELAVVPVDHEEDEITVPRARRLSTCRTDPEEGNGSKF